jgi:hypothetical protein
MQQEPFGHLNQATFLHHRWQQTDRHLTTAQRFSTDVEKEPKIGRGATDYVWGVTLTLAAEYEEQSDKAALSWLSAPQTWTAKERTSLPIGKAHKVHVLVSIDFTDAWHFG